MACGAPGEAHHVIEKSHVPPLWVRYDPDFCVVLCPRGHRGDARGGCDNQTAAHVSPLLFKTVVLARLLNSMDPPRAHKIRTYMDHVWKPSSERPDYKEIAARLREQIAAAEQDAAYQPESLRMHCGMAFQY